MKILRIALILSCAAITACTATVTPDQMNATMAQAATLIANGCKVVQPTLAGSAALTDNATVATGAAVNGVFCAANEAVAPATAPAAPAK